MRNVNELLGPSNIADEGQDERIGGEQAPSETKNPVPLEPAPPVPRHESD